MTRSKTRAKKGKRRDLRTRGSPRAGTDVIWPRGLEARYGISPPTRWRWERDGRLPKRDVFVGEAAVGWRPATLDAAMSGPTR
jgi:predicted DNA-binding transcriptional regulator AlpA